MMYYVYVVNLDKKVLSSKRFKERNPDYIEGKPCVYVGQSVHEPKIRFKQHLEGYKSNSFARKHGTFLRHKNTGVKNPYKTRSLAEKAEKKTALRLQKKGYGVWSG